VETLSADADELGCRTELEHIHDLLERGTGADRQLAMAAREADLQGLVAQIAETSRP
jgi:glutamate---cysteine ligase / carboxylate-amine ligase